MPVFAGIDPGLKGAIVAVEYTLTEPPHVSYITMPLIKTGKRSEVDSLAVHGFLVDRGISLVVIEEVQTFPKLGRKQGIASTGRYFRGHGKLLAAVEIGRIPHSRCYPKTWQKAFGISSARGDTKDQAIFVARQRFPTFKLPTNRVGRELDGVADALLMAEFARISYTGSK